MLDRQTRLRLSDDVTFQSMGSDAETVVLSLASGYLYTCNDTTACFLSELDGQKTFGEVVDALVDTYDAPREQIESDLQALADELLSAKLITDIPCDAEG